MKCHALVVLALCARAAAATQQIRPPAIIVAETPSPGRDELLNNPRRLPQESPPRPENEEIDEVLEAEATGKRLKAVFESAKNKEAGEGIAEKSHAARTTRRTK